MLTAVNVARGCGMLEVHERVVFVNAASPSCGKLAALTFVPSDAPAEHIQVRVLPAYTFLFPCWPSIRLLLRLQLSAWLWGKGWSLPRQPGRDGPPATPRAAASVVPIPSCWPWRKQATPDASF